MITAALYTSKPKPFIESGEKKCIGIDVAELRDISQHCFRSAGPELEIHFTHIHQSARRNPFPSGLKTWLLLTLSPTHTHTHFPAQLPDF